MTQALDARFLAAAGKLRADIHGFAAEIECAALANRAEIFEDDAIGNKARMTTSAGFVFTMPRQRITQRQLAELRFVSRQFWNDRRRRRNLFAQDASHNPVAAFD